jgi:hypothetical protein
VSLTPQHICQRCEFREKDFKPPRCACTISGKDITYHAAKRYCPKDFYAALLAADVESELERLGYDPNTSPQSPRVSGCCDPPRE